MLLTGLAATETRLNRVKDIIESSGRKVLTAEEIEEIYRLAKGRET